GGRRRWRARRRARNALPVWLHGARRAHRRGGAAHGGDARRLDSPAPDRRRDARAQRPGTGRPPGGGSSGPAGALHVRLHRRRGSAPRNRRSPKSLYPEAVHVGRAGAPGAALAGDQPMTASASATNPTAVLVVDDDPVTCATLRALLGGAGYAVTIAPDGLEAWEILQRERIPVVISDWYMPGLDG